MKNNKLSTNKAAGKSLLKPITKKKCKPENLDLSSPDLYLNRELEWLRFNERVLMEAENTSVPLLERLKFLVIFDSNLDEFFMVRLSGLLRLVERIDRGERASYPDVEDADDMFDEVSAIVKGLKNRFSKCMFEQILPALANQSLRVLNFNQISDAERLELADFFNRQILPVLTPLAIDPAHPFPFLSNLSLYLAIQVKELGEDGEPLLGLVEVPRTLDRFVCVSTQTSGRSYVFLEELIKHHVSKLFPWNKVVGAYTFRVTRNLDFQLLEAEVKDLMKSMEFVLKDREQKIAVRLETETGMPDAIRNRLRVALDLDPCDVYSGRNVLGFRDGWSLLKGDLDPSLCDPPVVPRHHPFMDADHDIFAHLREEDVMLHHPFDGFASTLGFLKSAAEDPNVLAIKQTLYRTGGNSPVTEFLTRAAENGKQVTAVVELKARFDERTNIDWARKLERSGVHVVFGFVGLKTHAKCTLVIRRENGELRRYAHLSTGNYNSTTAKLYTDIAMFTSDETITSDIASLFNLLTGFNIAKDDPAQRTKRLKPSFQKLKASPFDIRNFLISMIQKESELHSKHGNGWIIIKVNSILDPKIIEALYAASCCGVKIDLIVRGMCAVRPNFPGVSENIKVIAIIDRFLEHSRIIWFNHGGNPKVYLSSADLMIRNMDKRIEVLWPVETPRLASQIKSILDMYLRDNLKSHRKLTDGTYLQNTPEPNEPFRVQERLIM